MRGIALPEDPLRMAGFAALALGGAWLVATLGYGLFAPIGPVGSPPPVVQREAAASDLSALERFEPFFREAAAPQEAGPSIVSLGLTLHAVRRGADGRGGSAILAAAGQPQRSIGVGEEVAPGVVLEAVGVEEVILRRGSERTRLGFAAPGGPPATPIAVAAPAPLNPPSGPSPAAPQTEVDLPALLAAVQLEPWAREDQTPGYRLRIPSPTAATQQAGLEDGDILLAIDGQAIAKPEDVEPLLQRLASRGEARLLIERRGGVQTLVWRFPPN